MNNMNKIKKYREENGMSLNDLSQKTNINYNMPQWNITLAQ